MAGRLPNSPAPQVLRRRRAAVATAATVGVTIMRCYFMSCGHIEAVEELTGLSDEEAIAKAHALFSARKYRFEGFELWDRTRVLFRHPEPAASNHVAAWPPRRASRRAVASIRPAG